MEGLRRRAPWSRARLAGTKPAVVSNEEVDFERVAEVRPDLMTDVEFDMKRGDYEKLTELAPTVVPAWAEQAGVGDTIGFAGPRVHWEPREDAGWTLLAADKTGLPALLAIAEQLPVGRRAIAVAAGVIGLDLPDGSGEAWGGESRS
jgi:hypothetical protein